MIKNCSFIFCVWFRKNDPKGPPYCVNITCTVHKPKATWSAMTQTLDDAVGIIDNFPLVQGGIASGEDGFLIHKDCIIGKIPKKVLP